MRLRRRLKHYPKPAFLRIDEVGYLSYSNRIADLLFEIVNQRYEQRSTLVTTNHSFGEWNEVLSKCGFCVVLLVDRLVHHSEMIAIEDQSCRMKEAQDQAATKRSETQ